jgi:hypothetical protein
MGASSKRSTSLNAASGVPHHERRICADHRMIFQPAIIALLLAASLSLFMLLAAAPFAVRVIRDWDIHSGSERQLKLERLTYLFSTLIAFVCLLQILAALLFVFNADKLSVMFVGAMCAVGALNVNEFGFPALYAQLTLFFLASIWLIINHADSQARDYPLVRLKYALLLAAIPLFALSLWLQWRYFSGLKADVITSCCGSMFSEGAANVASEVAAWMPSPRCWRSTARFPARSASPSGTGGGATMQAASPSARRASAPSSPRSSASSPSSRCMSMSIRITTARSAS